MATRKQRDLHARSDSLKAMIEGEGKGGVMGKAFAEVVSRKMSDAEYANSDLVIICVHIIFLQGVCVCACGARCMCMCVWSKRCMLCACALRCGCG